MADLPSPPADTASLLALARRDRGAATKALGSLDLEAQVALVCDAPVGRRAALIELAPFPEEIVPRLPEAELCFTVKAVGLESAGWLLEAATPQQTVAALDLDVWEGNSPAPAKLSAWLDALAETGDDVLLRNLRSIDPELLVLHLMARIGVVLKPDDAEGWEPPEGSQTLDGQFHFVALHPGDDVAAVRRTLQLLFERDYWTYFRLLQGVIWELPTENEEWALRWRNGRLEDLGFPSWEDAMAIYGHLRPEQRAELPDGEPALEVAEWHLPVWVPALPAGADSRHAVFRAIGELEPEERRAALYAFVALANKVAVADRLELSDAETTPRAIEKAARWASRGLEHLARENGVAPVAVLRRASLARLFRVGANLDPDAARAEPAADGTRE